MHVCEPRLIKENDKQYIQYKLIVRGKKNPIYKTYSDFYEFQKKLTNDMPGLYIPCLPEKILIDNPTNDLLIKRKNLLNNFCSKIQNFKYIINSEEFEYFLKENKNNNNSEIVSSKLNINEIFIKYQKYFKTFNNNKEEIIIKKIDDSIIYTKNNLKNLEKFKNDVLSLMNEKENEFKNLKDLIDIFIDYEKNVLIQYTNNDLIKLIFMNPENESISFRINNLHNFLINPFIKLLEWIEDDILDFKSMQNTLESFSNLILLYKNKILKLNEINKNINELNNNYNNYLNILMSCSQSSSENNLENLLKEKEIIENEKNNLLSIIKIIDKVNEEYISKFKQEKMDKYNAQFKIFVEEDKKNRYYINDLWIIISNSLKIQSQCKENKEQNISP